MLRVHCAAPEIRSGKAMIPEPVEGFLALLR
jgi:hypothetical protein